MYHVTSTSVPGFKLGQKVEVKVEPEDYLPRQIRSSERYIWPACLPKDNEFDAFKTSGDVNSILVGWLDAPPITQQFLNIVGSSLGGLDVLRFAKNITHYLTFWISDFLEHIIIQE